MEILPAIDIQGGRVARARPGCEDPIELAERYRRSGARWLHVVDLDRAFRTGTDNLELIRRICGLPGARIQAGGNVDDLQWGARLAGSGVARVVWSAAMVVRRPAPLPAPSGDTEWAAAIEVRAGRPVARSSQETLPGELEELAARIAAAGVRTIVYRNLELDGTLEGLDLDGVRRLATLGLRVIAAGGVGSLDDVRAAQAAGAYGVIVGRALHEERFTLAEAIACSLSP